MKNFYREKMKVELDIRVIISIFKLFSTTLMKQSTKKEKLKLPNDTFVFSTRHF